MEVKSRGRKIAGEQAPPHEFARTDQATQPVQNQIATLLRQRIMNGQYTRASGLPPELNLMDEFEVSRYTVRAALQKLVIDGLIERRRGVGTTITPKDSLADSWAVGSLDDLVGQFETAKLIFAGPVSAKESPDMAKLFGLGKTDSLFKVVRVLKTANLPYAYSTIFTRTEYGVRIPRKLISKRLFLSLVEEYCRVHASQVRQAASSIAGPADAAKALDVPLDYPMLRLRRLYMTRSGEPITHAELFCRSDRYTPVVVLFREGEPVDTANQAPGHK